MQNVISFNRITKSDGSGGNRQEAKAKGIEINAMRRLDEPGRWRQAGDFFRIRFVMSHEKKGKSRDREGP